VSEDKKLAHPFFTKKENKIMPATAGSTYQAIRLKHIANTPPNCDPIRANENSTMYFTRMAAQGLPPDIDLTESNADYEIRLATYQVNPPVESISSVYSVTAGSSATSTGGLTNKLYVITASLANVALSANALPKGTYAITSSWATNAVNAPAQNTAAYVSGAQAVLGGTTADNITITNTSGKAINATVTTTGNAVYAQSLYSQAVWGVQAKVTPLAANIEVGAIAAYRSIFDTGSFNVNAAAVTAGNQYDICKAPLYSGTHVSTEVFKVDWNGDLYSSGSKGHTGTVMLAGPVTMAFQGGLLITVA